MGFLKKLILMILRTIIASMPTIFIYSSVRALTKLLKPPKLLPLVKNTSYFNKNSWLLILVATISPISRITLSMLFAPIEYLLNKKLKYDKSKNPFLKGNFSPCDNEHAYEMVDVTSGKVPTDIQGVYLRNGPNMKYFPPNGRMHWFDGDGMVHALRIKGGKIFYCNRYTQTPRYLHECKTGQAEFIRAGELFMGAGLVKAMIFGLQEAIGYKKNFHKYKKSTANTAFANHANRALAMLEADFPFHIKIEDGKDGFDIKSIGHDTFDGKLTHNISAHPKVDRVTGEMMAFGYNVERSLVHYSLIDKNRNVVNSMEVPVASGRMLHDFAATENYSIIPDLPLECKPELCFKNEFMFKFDQQKPARYGIFKRNSKNPDDVMWFELPNHYVFHYFNAWEDKNAVGDDVIYLYGCAQMEVSIDLGEEHPFMNAVQASLSKFTFNLTTQKADWKILEKDVSMEFPVIDQDLLGRKVRYGYASIFKSTVPDSQVGKDNAYFEAVIKYDFELEKIVGRIDFGETRSAGEVFFNKRDDAKTEDDGYLMSFVFDYTTNKSEFVMWDALTMENEPVLRAETRSRVPNGFHGIFIKEDELEK